MVLGKHRIIIIKHACIVEQIRPKIKCRNFMVLRMASTLVLVVKARAFKVMPAQGEPDI